MVRCVSIVTAAVIVASLAAQSAFAQGQQGLFGSRSVGSTIPNRTSNFGGGGGITGSTTQGIGSSTLQAPSMSVQRQEGGFVGSDASDVPEFMRMLQSGAGQGRQIDTNQRNSRANQNNNRGQSNQLSLPRVSYHIAFKHTPASAQRSQQIARNRIDRMFRSLDGAANAEVTFAGRNAILKGTVATEYDRVLAGELVSLQPGIALVDNQLQVAPESPPLPPQ